MRGPFVRYLCAATTSRLADEALAITVVLFLLTRHEGAVVAGAAVMVLNILGVVSGPYIGHRLDQARHRKLLMCANPVAVAVSLACLVVLAGHVPAWILPFIFVVPGVTNPLNTGGFTSLIPLLVRDDARARANGLEAASYSSSGILGPAIAGLAVATGGATVAVWINAAIAAAAIPLIALTPIPRGGGGPAWAGTLGETVAEFLRDRRLTAVTAATTLSQVGLGLLVVAMPRFAEALGSRAAVGGYLFALFGVSSAVGAVALARPANLAPLRGVAGALVWLGALICAWAAAPSLPWAFVLILLAGVADGPLLSALFASRQLWARPSHFGRVTTTAASLRTGAYAVGSFAGGLLVGGVGVRATLLACGGCQVVSACVLPLVLRAAPVRRAGRTSVGAPDG